jgi:hypothetical protein
MAWTFVQGTSIQFGVISSTNTLAYGSNVAVGDLLIVDVATNNTSLSGIVVGDSQGNTYSSAGNTAQVGLALLTFYTLAKASGANTVSITPTGAAANVTVALHEYSGNAASSPFDTFNANATLTPTTSLTTGTVPVDNPGEMIHAAFAQNSVNDVYGPGSGFTTREDQNNGAVNVSLYTMDGFPFSTGTAATVSSTASVAYVAVGTSWIPGGSTVDNLPWLPRQVVREEVVEYLYQ